MSDVELRISAEGISHLIRQLERLDRKARRLGDSGERIGRGFTRGLTGATRSVGGLISKIGGLAAAGGFAALAKGVVDFDEGLTRLAINAGKGSGEIRALRKQIIATSRSTFQSAQDLTAGMARVVEITGDYDLAKGSIEAIGRVATATGASIEDVAAAAAEMGQKLKIKPDEIERMFNILATQGKAGSFELKNMAQEFPTLLAGLASFGQKGEGALRSIGAFLQMARQGKGNAQETGTAVAALMMSLQNADVQKRLGKIGIKDVGISNPVEIVKALIRKTGGDVTQIASIMKGRGEARQAITPLANMYRETGGFGKLDQLQAAPGEGIIKKDFATYAESPAAAMKRIRNEAQNQAAEKLSDSLRTLATKSDLLVKGVSTLANAIPGVVAALVGLKAATIALTLAQKFGGKGGSLGGLIGKGGKAAGAGKALSGAGKALGVVGAVAGSLTAGYAIGTAVDEMTGASDLFSDMAFRGMRKAGLIGGMDMGSDARAAGLRSTAAGLAAAARAGATTFGSSGNRQALTTENVRAVLEAAGQRQGLAGKELADAVASALAANPIRVVVQTKGGLEKSEVQAGRGSRQ